MKPLGFGNFPFVADFNPCRGDTQDMNLPYVPSDEDEDQNGQDENMQHIKPHQRDCAKLLTAAKEVGDSVTDERDAISNFQPDGSAPVGFLIPRQSVTCQAEADNAQKEQNAAHPNHLPRLLVCAP